LSAKREYFRVQRKENIFDLCGAPFGKGYFFSWWLGSAQGFFLNLISLIPFFGEMIINFIRPLTYYKIDTALMFQESVRLAILEVIDQQLQAKGLRALSENERKPILKDLYKR